MSTESTIAQIAGGAIGMGGILKFIQMWQDKKTKIKVNQSDWQGVRLEIEDLKQKTDRHQILIIELKTEFKTRMEYIQSAFFDINKKLDQLIKLNGGTK